MEESQFTPASELKYDEKEMEKIMRDTENFQERLERTDRNPKVINKRKKILKHEFTKLIRNASIIVAKYNRIIGSEMTDKEIEFKINFMKKLIEDINEKTKEKGYTNLDYNIKRNINQIITRLENEISEYKDKLEANLFGVQLDMAGRGKKKKSKKKTKKKYGGKKKKCGGKKKKCGGKTKKKRSKK